MPRSHGERKKTRKKLSKRKRERGLSPISRTIQRFELGESVHTVSYTHLTLPTKA